MISAMESTSPAMQAAANLSSTQYRSFADATRAVLDLLASQVPGAAIYLAHLDRGHDIHRIVDTRNGGEFGLRSNLALPLSDSFDAHMADDRGPRIVQRRRRPSRLRQRRRAAALRRRLLPRHAARALRRLAGRRARRDGARTGRVPRRARAALRDARARARLRTRARDPGPRPAPPQRLAARPGARDGRRRPRRPRALGGRGPRAPRSSAPPARPPTPRSPSCSSRPAASSSPPRCTASRWRP